MRHISLEVSGLHLSKLWHRFLTVHLLRSYFNSEEDIPVILKYTRLFLLNKDTVYPQTDRYEYGLVFYPWRHIWRFLLYRWEKQTSNDFTKTQALKRPPTARWVKQAAQIRSCLRTRGRKHQQTQKRPSILMGQEYIIIYVTPPLAFYLKQAYSQTHMTWSNL